MKLIITTEIEIPADVWIKTYGLPNSRTHVRSDVKSWIQNVLHEQMIGSLAVGADEVTVTVR